MKKADNFDSSKWLVENKITTQSRLNEEQYSTERVNPRDVEIAGGEVINHTFDTVDVMDLDNGYQVKIVSTYWYRDPGVKGYSERNSKENPMISGVKTTLIDPLGKPIKNHNFTGSGQWWMLTLGKDKFIPYITDWWKQKIDKLDLSKSRLNEGKVKNQYVVKDKEESDEYGDFYSIDKKKAFEYLKQFNSKEVSAKQFIKDEEGFEEFESNLDDVEQMTDQEIEKAMKEELSFYYFSKPDEI
jgi:hypothetical protein